jgi:predicted ester cyclase
MNLGVVCGLFGNSQSECNAINVCKGTDITDNTFKLRGGRLMTIPAGEITDGDRLDIGKNAKCALERVCSGAGLDPPSRYYSPKFVDHVNNLKFYGLEGIRQSLVLYTNVLSDIKIEVVDQLVEGNRDTSRFVIRGVNRGRQARFNGITISRFENGLIIEDWSVTDTFSMLRQLGLWRSILVTLRQWRSLRTAAKNR